MKRKGLLGIFCFIGMLSFLYGQTVNYPPSCTVTLPHSNAYFKAGTDVEIHVYSSDIGKTSNNGTVTKVEFYNGTTLLGEATTHTNYTYKFVWGCVPAGTYTIKAKSTNNRGVSFTSAGVVITVGTTNVTQRGMSACKGKYLANIIPGSPQINYNTHWNGVTAENNCKWGPVEGSRDNFNWSGADVCYNHAKNNNMMFRYHALMWASQYPTWFKGLNVTDSRAEALEYMTAVAQRFPLSDQVDVINEQLSGHQPDNPVFASQLGGGGTTGYDWQIWVFTQARALFPNTKLILNDYGLENDQAAINSMLGLVKALRDRGLIDGFGTQAHCFNVDQTSGTQLKSALDLMATGGVPVYVTELDLNGGVESESNASQQLSSYQTHFPVYWDHPAVAGITIWGYISGATWKTGTGLMSSTGTEKSAFTWLKNYVTGKPSVGFPACSTGACTTVGTPPVVAITAPANNATFAVGANVTISADASDSDGNVTKVEFYNGTTKLGEDAASPYSYSWAGVAEGFYTITAVATDNSGNKTTSAAVNITVGNPRTPMITNGEFDLGTNGWDIQNNSGANGTMTVVTNGNLSGTNSLRICPATPGTAGWHVQVRQAAPLTAGKNYRITFMAKADAARTMTVSLQQDVDPYTTYFEGTADLTTTSQTFTYEFNATVTDASAKLKFYVGGNSTCVLIDKVEVSEGNFQLSSSITPAGVTTFCAGGSVVLNANTGTGYTYVWKKDGAEISGATTASYTANQSGSYTVTISANSQTVTSAAVVVTVNATPAAPTVETPVSYCQNATATALTATGTALKWYTVPSNGTPLSSAPVPSTASVATTNYYVSQTVSGCESSRALIAVSVNATPSTPTVTTPVTYCQNATATALTATGTGLKWYTVPTNGTASSTAPVPTTASAGTTNHYVSQTVSGCESARAQISVTVNATGAPVVATPVSYCQNATATALTATGTSLKWYTTSGSGSPLANAPVPSTVAAGTTNYYVSQTINGCEGSKAEIVVVVNESPQATVTPQGPTTFVEGNSVALNASTGTGYSYQWFNGTSVVGSAAVYTAAVSGNYTVEVSNSTGCKTLSSGTVVTVNANQPSVVTINSPSANSTVTGTVVTIDVSVQDPDGNVTKVEYYSGGVLIGTSTSSPYVFEWNNPGAGTHDIVVKVTDSNGGVTSSAPVTVTVEVATGILPGGYKKFTGIAPNPSGELFRITSSNKIHRLRITNMYGEEVEVWNDINPDQTTEIGYALSDGTYLLVIEYASGAMEVAKLVKIK